MISRRDREKLHSLYYCLPTCAFKEPILLGVAIMVVAIVGVAIMGVAIMGVAIMGVAAHAQICRCNST